MKLLKILLSLFILFPYLALAQEEYSFDLSEIEKQVEKKPYSIGGYFEFRPNFFWLDQDSAFYKLRFFDRSKRKTLDEYNFRLLLDATYQKGIANFFLRTNADLLESDLESDVDANILEGYMSLKPSPFFAIDLGKKTLNWGKGYAWNPVGFLQRPKNPDDPDLPLEGFIVASADYIKSFNGPLQTVTITPVLIPVYEDINDDFGDINHVNFAGKIYLLFYDTDIDFMFLTGGSKSSRLGVDFAKNITTNFELHGEFAFIDDFKEKVIDRDGKIFERIDYETSYLLGLRYLTRYDTTFIMEYYHNGTGFTKDEMQDFFAFIEEGEDLFLTSGDDGLLGKASSLAEKTYGSRNPMRDYLYLRISQKEPFDILYFTPSITWIYNINDRSYSLSPELLYTGITNLEFRLKGGIIVGARETEYGEKQNDYRLELRVRYYFDATKLANWIKGQSK
jgi:hypothetical protein